MPGVAILLEACVAGAAVRVKAQRGARGQGVGGDEVPDVEREDVGGKEIDVAGGEVTLALAVAIDGLDFVSAGDERGGSLDLNAPKAGAGVDDEVVAFAVAPGLGDADLAELGGVEEGGLGEFSDALGVGAWPVGSAGAWRLCRALRKTPFNFAQDRLPTGHTARGATRRSDVGVDAGVENGMISGCGGRTIPFPSQLKGGSSCIR